jgi:hypothetical protein
MMSKFLRCVLFTLGVAVVFAPATARAQDQDVYVDSLVNGWESWGWATLNYANTSPVHGGTGSISVAATAWQAIYLHHASFATNGFQYLSFWIHGGGQGGQRMQVQALLNGSAQTAVPIGPLPANTWTQFRISLSQLGVANASNMDGFWIQDTTGATQPTWYVDDIRLEAVPPPSTVNISVNAANHLRIVDNRMFGVNAAVWDNQFDTATTVQYLADARNQILRFPGGSLSDEYHWATNTTLNNTWTWATSFDKFAHTALLAGSQAFITVNYGTGTPAEAADWVRYSNVTKGYGFKHWEIGNENYGSWEADSQSRPHDAWTYANRARDYIVAMKAVDPTIRIGVVAVTGEDSYANYTDHPATNLRTGRQHNGWTAVMLTRLRELGITPDFIVYHRYAQAPFAESDQGLLQNSASWTNDAADLRQQLSDYLGASGSSVELICTENNSVYTTPGKQSTSLVNGLFYADSLAQVLKTEFKGFVWWDMRNGQEPGNNNASSLYGWRLYGDYGMVSPSNERYPTYYVFKLTQWFARGGDTIVQATSDYSLLSAYASLRQDGNLALMVINKSPGTTFNANVAISGYTPSANGIAYSYGIPQDEAARTGSGSPDLSQSAVTNASASFSRSFAPYSVTVLSLSPAGPPPPPPPAVPAAPSNLTAIAASSTQINLAWTDNANNETGQTIERSTNGTTFTLIATVGANVTSYASTGLKKNTKYYFRVRATNSAGDSGYSNTASATTPKR